MVLLVCSGILPCVSLSSCQSLFALCVNVSSLFLPLSLPLSPPDFPPAGIKLTLSALLDGKNVNAGGHKLGLGLEFQA